MTGRCDPLKEVYADERAEAAEIRGSWDRLDRAREEVSADDWYDRD